MELDQVHTHARTLSRKEWADLLIEHAEDPVDGVPPMPSEGVQRLTNNRCGRDTMSAGADWYHAVWALLEDNDISIQPSNNLMDVGVGWGRMQRFLLHDLPVGNLAGVDVNERLITACNELLPGGEFHMVEPRDPMPFAADSFDFVVNNSLFSHLSVEQHLHTLDQIVRVLRPGGYLVSTVLTRRHVVQALRANADGGMWSGVEDRAAMLAKVEAGEFFFHKTQQGRMAEYGRAVVPYAWMEKNWTSRVQLLAFDDECAGQSLVLARKPL